MISIKEVEHIAKLARLGLKEKEIERYQKELSSVLDYINLLEKADTSNIAERFHSKLTKNNMRDDIAKEQDAETRSKIIELAPEKEKGYIKVKAVFKN